MSRKPWEIEQSTGGFRIRIIETDPSVQQQPWTFVPCHAVKQVTGFIQLGFGTRDSTNLRKNPVRETDTINLVISFHDENNTSPIQYDIQYVNNQAGWTADLAGLQQAIDDVNSWCGDSSSPPGGLATESTLVSVLNAIVASDQDIEVLLVRDTGNANLVVKQVTDYASGTPVTTYEDVNGNSYVPTGPIEYLDPSSVLNLILSELASINNNTVSSVGSVSNVTTVASSSTNVQLLPANASRISAKIFNDSTEILYVKEGSLSSTSSFTWQLLSGEAVVINDYSGLITGIWSAANGDAKITETLP